MMRSPDARTPETVLEDIGDEVRELLYGYIQAQSFTCSPEEKSAEAFFMSYFSQLPYFSARPESYGTWPIAGDVYDRAVCYAVVRGTGPETIVLLHHTDVVTVADFKLLKPYAFSPDRLAEELYSIRDTLAPEARADLESGNWLFGRGVCDMKGGGSIQMVLLNRYSQLESFQGNVIVLGVPDEETLSAGMRAAVLLLAEFQQKYGFVYKLAVNSEPHQRKAPSQGILSLGSVGKLMPFIYVRGSLAHAGKVFEGFNPLGLISEIVRNTEMNIEMSDTNGNEAAPPPTWLYLRDDKPQYDVSMPLSVFGCFSILTLNQTPPSIMKMVRRICEEAFANALRRIEDNYTRYQLVREQPGTALSWKANVMDFATLYSEAAQNHGEAFTQAYNRFVENLGRQQAAGEISFIECHTHLLSFVYDYIDDLSPRVVYGLIPPYYPNVSNHMLPDLPDEVSTLPATLCHFAKSEFGQTYETENYYTGISDLSYTSLSDAAGIHSALQDAMPLFQRLYDLPLDGIEKISMPCINIGPWGKDFHKLTERVLLEDLTRRTPALLHKAVTTLLQPEA